MTLYTILAKSKVRKVRVTHENLANKTNGTIKVYHKLTKKTYYR